MPSRRTHTKSRHGCTQCKASHVKCDALRPTCGRCSKHGKECLYSNLEYTPTTYQTPLSPASSSTTPSEATGYDHDFEGSNTLQRSPNLSDCKVPMEWDDLELFHHYITDTHLTLAYRVDIQRLWRIEIPRIAMKQSFLLHSILGVTAVHLAFTCPEKKTQYVNSAIRHHHIALCEYTSQLQNITTENGPAVFLCASMIVIYSLSFFLLTADKSTASPIEEMLGVFKLLRGIRIVTFQIASSLRTSDLAPFFVGEKSENAPKLAEGVVHALRVLEERNRATAQTASLQDLYHRAIQEVRVCFLYLADDDKSFGNGSYRALGFPVTVDPEFNGLLDAREPMALLILGYYAVALHGMRDIWWVLDWGRRLVPAVHQRLDDEWKQFMAWPMAQVGIKDAR